MLNKTSSCTITVCTTCDVQGMDANPKDAAGKRLFDVLRTAITSKAHSDRVGIVGYPCLWACTTGCVVQVSEPGKPTYLIGKLDPENTEIGGVVDFAEHYQRMDDGVVPYTSWPGVVQQRFLARMPATLVLRPEMFSRFAAFLRDFF